MVVEQFQTRFALDQSKGGVQMRKIMNRIMACIILCTFLIVTIQPIGAQAANVVMIKIPIDAQVMVKGKVVDEKNLAGIEAKIGRIHELAAQQTGAVYGYKQYLVSNLAKPDDVIVYDSNMVQMYPTYADAGIIDYTGNITGLGADIESKVQNAAIVFHNRTGGFAWEGLTTYFQQGSDAYNKIVASDSGRKWGKFIVPAGITEVQVSEIYQYTEQAFTAKATIITADTVGYVENYDVYFLFQHNGTDFKVTYFTYMP